MRKTATINELLGELSLKSLKEVCRLRGIEVDAKRRAPLIESITPQIQQFSEEQKKFVVNLFKNEKAGTKNFTAHIFSSDDLPQKDMADINTIVRNTKFVVQGERLKPGFGDVVVDNKTVHFTFRGRTEKFVPIEDGVLKDSHTISIPVSLICDQGSVILKGNVKTEIRTCREFVKDKLNLKKLYYSIPDGIKDEGADVRDYNGRVRDFVSSLQIEAINGVYLKIGDQTKIKGIDYRGRGDILKEKEIKSKIKKDLIVGLKGLIRHNNGLVEFFMKWGYLCHINIRAQGLSNAQMDEILKDIYSAYKEHIVK